MSLSISWHGLSCFTISSKFGNDEAVIITDPYDNSSGLRVPKTWKADVVTVSENNPLRNNVQAVDSLRNDKKVFAIASPGEYEISDIFVYGIPAPQEEKNGNIIYRIEIGGFSLCHLGRLNYEPGSKELETIGDVDILFVPVDGPESIDIKKISGVISSIDPQIVVPMNWKIPNLKVKAEPLEKLLKELGVKEAETVKKLKLARKEFGEEMRVVVIEKD